MKDRLGGYGNYLETMISEDAEVFNFGIVDHEYAGREAGEWFNEKNVDLILCNSATYFTSTCTLPIHQINKAPLIILNLQPTP